jgi:hypothetical protein
MRLDRQSAHIGSSARVAEVIHYGGSLAPEDNTALFLGDGEGADGGEAREEGPSVLAVRGRWAVGGSRRA